MLSLMLKYLTVIGLFLNFVQVVSWKENDMATKTNLFFKKYFIFIAIVIYD